MASPWNPEHLSTGEEIHHIAVEATNLIIARVKSLELGEELESFAFMMVLATMIGSFPDRLKSELNALIADYEQFKANDS